jgi:hypothetical protein
MQYCKTWDDLVEMLKLYFLPDNYDKEIEKEILNRKQQEPYVLFHAKMEKLFQKLSYEAKEDMKLSYVKDNLCDVYKGKMIRFKPKNFKELAVVCKEIESVLPEDFWNRRREKVHEVEQLSEEEESVEQREHVEAIKRPKPVEGPLEGPSLAGTVMERVTIFAIVSNPRNCSVSDVARRT